MSRFEKLRAYAESYWGLRLIKNNGSGRYCGDWKTGYSLIGSFPGFKHSWRRFDTLKQVAKALQYPMQWTRASKESANRR